MLSYIIQVLKQWNEDMPRLLSLPHVVIATLLNKSHKPLGLDLFYHILIPPLPFTLVVPSTVALS